MKRAFVPALFLWAALTVGARAQPVPPGEIYEVGCWLAMGYAEEFADGKELWNAIYEYFRGVGAGAREAAEEAQKLVDGLNKMEGMLTEGKPPLVPKAPRTPPSPKVRPGPLGRAASVLSPVAKVLPPYVIGMAGVHGVRRAQEDQLPPGAPLGDRLDRAATHGFWVLFDVTGISWLAGID